MKTRNFYNAPALEKSGVVFVRTRKFKDIDDEKLFIIRGFRPAIQVES